MSSHGKPLKPTPKREYDSLIDREIALIAYYRLRNVPEEDKAAKRRLQQWFRLQAEQEGKR